QPPRREAPGTGPSGVPGAVAPQLDRQLHRDQLDEHLAREARMAGLLRKPKHQVANVRAANVETRFQPARGPLQIPVEPGADRLGAEVAQDRGLTATSIAADL